MPRTVKVAVVGSGLAGLVAAHNLAKTPPTEDVRFEVHLFEKSSALGMDSSSVSLPAPDGTEDWRVDVPMRSFQGGYYPRLIALYKQLGVAFRQSDFSYSFSRLTPATDILRHSIQATMIYNGDSGRNGVSMPSTLRVSTGIKTQPLTYILFSYLLFALFTFRVLFHFVRLQSLALPFWRPAGLRAMTFREWSEHAVPRSLVARTLRLDSSWRQFVRDILVPLFSAVCTASEEDIMDHPAEEFLDYIWLTLGMHHYVVEHGARDVVARLAAPLHHLHLSAPITALQLDGTHPGKIAIHTTDSRRVHTGFAHIVFATQANHAAPLLAGYAKALPPDTPQRSHVEALVRCLSTFKYRPTVVVNHTDDSLMPDNHEDRRDLNMVCMVPQITSDSVKEDRPRVGERPRGDICVSTTYTMATHVLPRPKLYSTHLSPVYQTTNPIVAPRQASILSVARLERAVLSLEAKVGLQGLHYEERRRWWQCAAETDSGLGPLQGCGAAGPGIWVCGSYAAGGIPLLEGCVVSARNVVEKGILKNEGVDVPRQSMWVGESRPLERILEYFKRIPW